MRWCWCWNRNTLIKLSLKGKLMANVDQDEINKFDALASRFWDKDGEFKTLHQVNPLRLEFIQRFVKADNLNGLDIGCGGGILTEGLAKAGAKMQGIDLAKSAIDVAKLHLLESGLNINYHLTSAEDFVATHTEKFDFITCMEMLEHVPSPISIIQSAVNMLKPGAVIFFSTLNRNPRAFIEAIVGAEYVLGLIPKGTHTYEKFIKPEELTAMARQVGLSPVGSAGIHYNPLLKKMSISDKLGTNYLLAFEK